MSEDMIEVLDKIPFEIRFEEIVKSLKLRQVNSQIEEMVRNLVGAAAPVARPKAVYKVSYLDEKNGNTVDIDGVRFTSRVLRINLDNLNRVFPYVATCGRELEGIEVPADDLLKRYCLDAIKMSALRAAIAFVSEHIQKKYAVGKMSRMNPGSLEDWPITEQKPLFSLLGDVEKLVGVALNASYLMQPLKSTSGILFPAEVTFESCQLCPREKCPGRRARYDREALKKYERLPAR